MVVGAELRASPTTLEQSQIKSTPLQSRSLLLKRCLLCSIRGLFQIFILGKHSGIPAVLRKDVMTATLRVFHCHVNQYSVIGLKPPVCL
jgi:hypothetical protein